MIYHNVIHAFSSEIHENVYLYFERGKHPYWVRELGKHSCFPTRQVAFDYWEDLSDKIMDKLLSKVFAHTINVGDIEVLVKVKEVEKIPT